MIHTIEVPLFWGQTWPGTSLEAGDVVTATLDDEGNLIDLDGAPEGMESAELSALIEQA